MDDIHNLVDKEDINELIKEAEEEKGFVSHRKQGKHEIVLSGEEEEEPDSITDLKDAEDKK
jgi:hypothetical protein